MNSVEWLTYAAKTLEQHIFVPVGLEVPEKYSVHVGFPHKNTRAIGQAFDKMSCKDEETYNIFIHPKLGEDVIELLQVLAHEMLHITVGLEHSHGGDFKKYAKKIGFAGKMTATYAEVGSPLYEQLSITAKTLEDRYGKYPHIPVIPTEKEKKERAKNIITLVSENDPGYTVKIKKQLLEECGYPLDYEGNEMMEQIEE